MKFILTCNRQTLLLHTSFAEGLSTVLLESMTLGLPFISTPSGGNLHLANLGVGHTIPFNDHYRLSQKILELLDNQNNLQNMKLHASKIALNYSWSVIFPQIFELYEN